MRFVDNAKEIRRIADDVVNHGNDAYRACLYDIATRRNTSLLNVVQTLMDGVDNEYERFLILTIAGEGEYASPSKFDTSSDSLLWYDNEGVDLHRDGDLPAVISMNGDREWWENGQEHRSGYRPAYVKSDGSKTWWKRGKLHRDGDLPAIEWNNGDKEWWKNGERHRSGGMPAIISSDRKEWWENGVFQRGENI